MPRPKHGQTGTTLFKKWSSMLGRCRNPNHHKYHAYGGRGITVCERWLLFVNFAADMGQPPSSEHSLDRIDNDGNYEPGNCRWATLAEQSRNRRAVIWATFNGERMCLKDAAAKAGLDYHAVYSRVTKSGWSIEAALSTPIMTNSQAANFRKAERPHGRLAQLSAPSNDFNGT